MRMKGGSEVFARRQTAVRMQGTFVSCRYLSYLVQRLLLPVHSSEASKTKAMHPRRVLLHPQLLM